MNPEIPISSEPIQKKLVNYSEGTYIKAIFIVTYGSDVEISPWLKIAEATKDYPLRNNSPEEMVAFYVERSNIKATYKDQKEKLDNSRLGRVFKCLEFGFRFKDFS